MKKCKWLIYLITILMLIGCAKSPVSEKLSATESTTLIQKPATESTTQAQETTPELTTQEPIRQTQEQQVGETTPELTTQEPTRPIQESTITESSTQQTSTMTESSTQPTAQAQESTTQETTHEPTTEPTTQKKQTKKKGLKVKGSKLVDLSGNVVKLRGVSTHGLSWYPQYVNKEAFKFMRDEWKVNTIRLAMYTAEYNGYCTGDENNRQALIQLVDNGVSYATELGMYVIIDWHILSDNNPNMYKNQSIQFFDNVSKKYSKHTNVIYEICNEPNGGTSWEEIKSYAIDVIDTIRKNDKDAVIIVGTPNWSQYVDQAAASPIDRTNIMYALHFYADTHRDDLRNKMVNAINSGLPVIVSEFGICDASGNGNVNIYEADKWLQVIKENDISYVIWNLSNKQESSALINSSCNKLSNWNESELSESGKWFVSKK